MVSSGVFLRKSSGVIRAISPLEGMYYGYLSTAGIYTLVAFFILGPTVFPGANLYLGNIIVAVLCCIQWLNYSMMSSSMPRSGGDYVFQSRLLRADLGFALTFGGLVIWQMFYVFFAGSAIASSILPTVFDFIGHVTGNDTLIGIGIALYQPTNVVIVTIVLIWLTTLILLRGIKAYARIQNYFMIPLGVVALAIIVVMFLTIPRGTFIANFNSYQNIFAQNPDWYHTIIAKAKGLGFDPNPSFNWNDTLGYVSLLYGGYLWSMWSVELLGEIKGADRIRNTWAMLSGATLFELITCIIGLAWAVDYMGADFVKSLGYLMLIHPEVVSSFSWRGSYSLFTVIGLNTPFGILVGILIGLGFLGASSQSLFNSPIGASRLSLSMAMDRALPDWMGSVNKRGSPDKFIYFNQVGATIFTILLTVAPSLVSFLSASYLAGAAALLGSIVAGTIFPWRAKKIFEESPASKYRFGGVPLIAIAGVVGIALNGMVLFYFLTVPGLGLVGATTAMEFVIALFVASFIWFYIAKSWRGRQGIQIALAYKEIPPE